MPTLQELKDKWFIDENTIFIDWRPPLLTGITFEALGLHFRHAGTALENHTDGNSVTPLFGEGEEYLDLWHELITDVTTTTVYNTNWTFDSQGTIITENKEFDPILTLTQMAGGTVSVYQFLCGNLYAVSSNLKSHLLLNLGGVVSTLDFRFPVAGSNHQKFIVAKTSGTGCALVGSIDITKARLDNNEHSGDFGQITHDFGIKVEGPAVADIERTFVERWNDSSRTRTEPFDVVRPDHTEIADPIGTYAAAGTHSIQVLRTYGAGPLLSYSWADIQGEGEFSIWASTLNAIKKAETYIYIEDQTFLTFGWPACCDQNPNPEAQETDLIYQLGEALKRGVRLGVIVHPGGGKYVYFQRQHSLKYLKEIVDFHGLESNFFVAYLQNGNDLIAVHSKMFIVDDEFALIGTANFDQRSMCHDGEIKLGIVDEENLFVKDLRSKFYQEHSEQDETNFEDPIIGFDNMKSYVDPQDTSQGTTGRLRKYPIVEAEKPFDHAFKVNTFYWPYAGPQNLR